MSRRGLPNPAGDLAGDLAPARGTRRHRRGAARRQRHPATRMRRCGGPRGRCDDPSPAIPRSPTPPASFRSRSRRTVSGSRSWMPRASRCSTTVRRCRTRGPACCWSASRRCSRRFARTSRSPDTRVRRRARAAACRTGRCRRRAPTRPGWCSMPPVCPTHGSPACPACPIASRWCPGRQAARPTAGSSSWSIGRIRWRPDASPAATVADAPPVAAFPPGVASARSSAPPASVSPAPLPPGSAPIAAVPIVAAPVSRPHPSPPAVASVTSR